MRGRWLTTRISFIRKPWGERPPDLKESLAYFAAINVLAESDIEVLRLLVEAASPVGEATSRRASRSRRRCTGPTRCQRLASSIRVRAAGTRSICATSIRRGIAYGRENNPSRSHGGVRGMEFAVTSLGRRKSLTVRTF